MGKHHLRNDMTCLNCKQVVEKRFCPNCGQENSESRKTFHHLFVHFFEDLTHYENAFWKTIRNLLLRPGSLTTEYLSGKRLSYLAPVRLYIFISFLTFFLLSVLPVKEEINEKDNRSLYQIKKEAGETDKVRFTVGPMKDSVTVETGNTKLILGDYKSIKEFDSIQNTLPANKRMSGAKKMLFRQFAYLNETLTLKQFKEKFLEGLIHNMPKALFLYMPFFALTLWIFHNKKRWFYFDHGIFTLHYFSFILLTYCIFILLDSVTSYTTVWINDIVSYLFDLSLVWWILYFFRSHRRFYGESKLVSRSKSFALFFINLFFMLIFTVALLLYTIISLH